MYIFSTEFWLINNYTNDQVAELTQKDLICINYGHTYIGT